MRRVIKSIFLILTAALLLLSCVGCSAVRLLRAAWEAGETAPAPAVYEITSGPVKLPKGDHKDVKFSDFSYVRPDVDAIAQQINELTDAIQRGAPTQELMEVYRQIQTLYNAADSQLSLAYLLYAFDVTEDTYEQEYSSLQNELTELDLAMTDVSLLLFESSEKTAAAARKELGEGFVDAVYAGESMNSETIQDLLKAENELIVEYDRLTAGFTLSAYGEQWTLDDILSDTELDYYAYIQLYYDFCDEFNQEAGKLFIELLGLRKQIAEKLGYGSYAAYGYDQYGRDYTVSDAKNLHALVKEYIVPVYLNAEDNSDELMELYDGTFELDSFLTALSADALDFSPALAESLGYMLRNDLYDTAVDAKKMTGSFTTYISDYQAPFLFTQWTDSSADPTTFVHELGHFTNYYHNPAVGWSASDSLDLAEIDSQALELLMTFHYDDLYKEHAEAAKTDRLLDSLYAIVSGCMEDEFQQYVYANPGATLTEMNACYKRLAEEYGLAQLYGFRGTEWVMVSHTFQTPMYYISYAVSMLAALELWEKSESDFDTATEIYLSILMRAPFAAFRDTLTQNGLADVFSEETVARLAGLIARTLSAEEEIQSSYGAAL